MSSSSGGDEKGGMDRRGLLRTAGAFAATTLAPGVTLYAFGGGEAEAHFEARPPQDPATSAQRWGLLIDVNKCSTGCNACVTACKDYNRWQDTGRQDIDPQWIRKVTLKDPATGVERSAPVMCQHCASPPCVDVCPTGASMKRADGIVLVNKHTCIGCRYCMMACPFKARSFIHEEETDQAVNNPSGKGTVEGCTLCVDRIDAGQRPACVEACAKEGGALIFGDLKDPQSEISLALRQLPTRKLRADLEVDQGVQYANL